MALVVEPIQDLVPVAAESKGAPQWQSDGEDPCFRISFPIIRRRFIVVVLASGGEALDPKVYVNAGYGFREQDAKDLGSGQMFAIKIDVGIFGTICSCRIDPATGPALVSVHAKGFATARQADEYLRRLAQRHSDLAVRDIGRVARFWRRNKLARTGTGQSATARYIQGVYEIAEASPRQFSRNPNGLPWISIVVPVYNAPLRYLDDLLHSFKNQRDEDAELIFSDDASTSGETCAWLQSLQNEQGVRVIWNTDNRGIAATTNAGIAAARGEWITLLDHDDLIAPYALNVIRGVIEDDRAIEFLYTDEVVVNDRLKPTGLMLKPAYDPVLLSGVNYINHFSIYKRKRLHAIGLQRLGFDGSQDYDLLLRYLHGLPEESIVHLPYPAYWWRRNGKSYSRKFMDKATDNARRALSEAFGSSSDPVTVSEALTNTLHRVQFDLAKDRWPSISIIIPNKNSPDLITKILSDLYEKTDYPNFQVIVIDNGTSDPEVLQHYDLYRSLYPSSFLADVRVEDFNFARAINRGMEYAVGEHFLVLNNDVEVIRSDWLKEMVSCLEYRNVGIVGAKLLYPDDKIQHAGVITGFGGLAGHWYLNKHKDFPGPLGRLHVRSSMTCVTGAVMLVSGECAHRVGQWDEENFAVAYNDVDYCIRAYKAGFRIVWTPFASLYHHESVSRGSDRGGESRKRFEKEKANLRRLHQTQDFIDPASNPGYSRDRSEPTFLPAEELHPPRRWFQ